jgi:AraC-like DNA-binding protein/transcriptional regulator with XRE-family HTH domain
MPEALLYGAWDFGPSAEPPSHTYLYRLQPVAVGSAFVESLTGYIARLADAHSVSVGALLTREILPRLRHESASPEGFGPAGSSLVYDTRNLNGVGEASDRVTALLEALTGSKNLNLLTLRPWSSVISPQRLLKSKRAWCPACLHDWRWAGREAYDSLVWIIDGVTDCPVHNCRLSSTCPHCGRSLHILSARSRPGLCCWCKKWMGCRNALASTRADTDAGSLASQWIADLLAATHEPGNWLSPDVFRNNLNTCIERVTDGNISHLCGVAGLSFDSVSNWRSGAARVRLDLFLKLCEALEIAPKTFLSTTLNQSDVERAVVIALERARHVRRRRGRVQIDTHLAFALYADPPISLRELATQLGYTKVQCLTRRAPEICASLRRKYNPANRRKPGKPLAHAPSDEVIRLAIESALAACPRIPLRTVTRSLGFKNEVSLYNRFPELCRAFAIANRKDRKQRLDATRVQCAAALLKVPPPTIREMAETVCCSVSAFRYRFPDLCVQLIERAPERQRILREQLRSQIASALGENPPPSIETVASRVGKDAKYLVALYPDLAGEIRRRFRAQRQADSAKRRARYRQQIGAAANDLWQRGLPISRKKVIAAIPDPVMHHCHIVDDELAEIVRQLGGDQV